ncbi:hypothetical protein BJF79_21230 [Actinomadura sp. CNU-125]|uniref:hypothetical protein n=1 Tax=Actinomadura sp. CNU-125 TaxID=1904961 RepID=UPI0009692A3D|nr:hypothetical protein [Actinomadura sp. CNU-125]OLT13126.1 hypothetical protein BJF79_21230 [Actinomadura sp. CNU-125]
MQAVTLCVPPRRGELCMPVRFDLTAEHTLVELTSRHLVTRVETDEDKGCTVVWVGITDPATSRPVHVRFSVLPSDADPADRPELTPRSRELGEVRLDGRRSRVYGTYLGVVSDEN